MKNIYFSTGLLESKETSAGHTFLYEYDENGRLSAVVQPTGERTIIATDVDPSGALAKLTTDSEQSHAFSTNGNMLSVLHGKFLKLYTSLILIYKTIVTQFLPNFCGTVNYVGLSNFFWKTRVWILKVFFINFDWFWVTFYSDRSYITATRNLMTIFWFWQKP